MTYKQALLLLLSSPKRWKKAPIFTFSLSALGASLLLFGLFHLGFFVGAPWWMLKQQGWPSELLWRVLPIDWVGAICALIGLAAMTYGLTKAHRVSLRIVEVLLLKSRHQRDNSAEQRLSRLTIAVAISLVVLSLWLLPQLTLAVGLLQTALSSMMLDEVALPWWVFALHFFFSFIGTLAILLVALYFRLVFSSPKTQG